MRFGSNEVALVSTDTYRIGATEQLSTYGRILNCPVRVAKDAEGLSDILQQLSQRKLVFLDTAGIGQQDKRLARQLDTLLHNSCANIHCYLVLCATSQPRVLQQTLTQFAKVAFQGCIVTKLDEARSLGEMISVLVETALPVMFLTNGQAVPEDIKLADSSYLVNKAQEFLLTNRQQQAKAADLYE